jgi:glycosyltransferase involved in cell wall biosynthesis
MSTKRRLAPENLRVALVHDWLTGMRGGERVLELLCELFPNSEIFTLIYKPGSTSATIEARPIHVASVDAWPLAHRRHQLYLPTFPFLVEQFDLTGFDLVVSTSHCVAKGALAPPDAPHLCYCFAPMRYAYDQASVYRRSVPAPLRLVWDVLLYGLRIWDQSSAARPDLFIGNSHHTAARILRAYRREAVVLHSPVDLEALPQAKTPPGDSLLVLSALVPYKRVDLAVQAASRLGRPLVVVGTGPERRRLEAKAGSCVEFRGWIEDEERAALIAESRCLLFPGEEDFGIVPLEVNAVGRPVVGYARGGLLETQVEGETAIFVREQSVEALIEGIEAMDRTRWDQDRLRANAERFSEQAFVKRFWELAAQRL